MDDLDTPEDPERQHRIARRQGEVGLSTVAAIDESVGRGVPADVALAGVYRRHRELGARDRRFLSALVFSHFRWRGWTRLSAAEDLREACILAHVLDALEVHPAVRVLASEAGIPDDQLQPLGSLALERRAARLTVLRGLARTPAPEALIPDWSRDVLWRPPGFDPGVHLQRCIEAFQSRPPTWIRARHGVELTARNAFRETGMEAGPHARMRQALALTGPRPALAAAFPELRGNIEVQDLASQAVGLICDPWPGSEWWDVCAGALGKTLHLADLAGGRCDIMATDVRSSTLDNGQHRLRDAGIRCVRLAVWDGHSDPAPQRAFDGVLVDAPCSSLGTWHRNPDARWRTQAKDVKAYAGTQALLLGIAASKVKPGGRLVYATCTLTGLENECVVRAFLDVHPEFEFEPFVNPLTDEACPGSVWIWPWQGPCNGMFVARLKRAR